jgi:hypothetical protein
VAATRGRDDNRIHVITPADDPAEARDVLAGVLGHERADTPAVIQRRHLAKADALSVPGPRAALPEWVLPWRDGVEDRRRQLSAGLDERERRRAAASRELADLQPAVHAAQDAWEPHAQPIRDLERRLDTELRPAMWSANHDAQQAGLGHRHATNRRAAEAARAVERALADIDAIRRDGAPIEQHLVDLQRRAHALSARAEPIDVLDQLDAHEIRQLDRILDAADTYSDWLDGRSVPPARLNYAVEVLAEVAEHAPFFSRHPGEPDRTQWYQLLELAPDHLDRGPTHYRRPPEVDLDLGP